MLLLVVLAVCLLFAVLYLQYLKFTGVFSSQSGDCPSQGIDVTLHPKAADRRIINLAQEILVRKALNFRNKDNWGGNLGQDIRSGK